MSTRSHPSYSSGPRPSGGTVPRRTSSGKRRRRRRLNTRGVIVLSSLFILALLGFYGLVFLADGARITLSISDGDVSTIECGDALSVPVVTATYSSRLFHRKGLETQVTRSGDLDLSRPGTYQVTYESSMKRRKAKATCTYQVVDTQPPVITLVAGEDYYTPTGKEYVEEGFTAIDACDGDLTDQVIREEADGKVTYTVSDRSGNTASVERTIRYKDKIVYLSFDDGPSANTEKLLDVLAKYNAKATFFVTNQHKNYQDCIAREYAEGHTVGVHTYSHKLEDIYSGVDAFFADIEQMSDIIEAQTGQRPTVLRFPGGSGNSASRKYCPGIMTELVQEVGNRGYVYADWNISSGDADGSGKSASAIARTVINGIQKHDPAFVLQHDTKRNTVAAMEKILSWGTENGYTFLPITATSPTYHGSKIRN